MGRKKAFIKKGEGQHFYLLHRSQTDGAYGGEDRPSDYVLVSSDKNDVKPKNVTFEDDGRGLEAFDLKSYAKARRQKDHITDLGFVNDGYDYTQHLMESDGSSFYGKDGKFYEMKAANSASSSGLQLPPEVLPSGRELERDLMAITIDHTLMDADLAAALFEDEDDEGGFEELQDDFVLAVMQEPDVPDFDFDAHMARLIALSEKRTKPSVSGQIARGWESKEEEEEDEDGYFSDNISSGEEGSDSGSHRRKLVTEKRISDERFNSLLDEYGEEQLGYGDEDEDEEDMHCGIDIAAGHAMFEDALDEFLTDKKDEIFAEGTLIKDVIFNKSYWNEPGQDVRDDKVIKENYMEQMMEQVVLEDEVKSKDKPGDAAIEELMTNQTYLSEQRVEEEWDCESVLSTYSTLDNHPKLIKEPGAGFKPRSNRYTRSVEAQYNGDGVSSILSGSSSMRNVTTSKVGTLSMIKDIKIGSGTAEKIVLTGKLGLPSTEKSAAKGAYASHLSNCTLHKIDERAADDNESDNDDDDDEDSEGSSDDETTATFHTDRSHRNKSETPEEKRLRKAGVKEERRSKRAQKKQLKGLFVSEQLRQVRDMARQQDINSVPVFKYSH